MNEILSLRNFRAFYNRINKKKLLIYLSSFLIFVLINNLFLALLSFFERVEFSLCVINGYPCLFAAPLYVYAFQAYKIILFLGFIFFLKRNPESSLKDFFMAYFIFDLVFILIRLLEFIVSIDNWYPCRVLISSLQTGLSYTSLMLASVWTILLMITLWKFNQLSLAFLIKRLVVIPFSIIIVLLTFYLLGFVK